MHDETEKQVVHRLEAFSDIVIGFSLAQLGLSLVIPRHASELFASGTPARGLIALAITFMLVCAVWWSHHRLFRHVFVPTRENILANFAALGGVIFLAYSMQVLIHVGFSDRTAYAMYTGSYAWITLLFAFMAWNGLRLRRAVLAEVPLRESVRFAWRMSIVGTWLAMMTAVGLYVGASASINPLLVFVLIAALAAHRIVSRRRASASTVPQG